VQLRRKAPFFQKFSYGRRKARRFTTKAPRSPRRKERFYAAVKTRGRLWEFAGPKVPMQEKFSALLGDLGALVVNLLFAWVVAKSAA
jgi:hypothetical protein